MTVDRHSGQANESASFEYSDIAGYPDRIGTLDQGSRLRHVFDEDSTGLEAFLEADSRDE